MASNFKEEQIRLEAEARQQRKWFGEIKKFSSIHDVDDRLYEISVHKDFLEFLCDILQAQFDFVTKRYRTYSRNIIYLSRL